MAHESEKTGNAHGVPVRVKKGLLVDREEHAAI
jgi:hypothetical protein